MADGSVGDGPGLEPAHASDVGERGDRCRRDRSVEPDLHVVSPGDVELGRLGLTLTRRIVEAHGGTVGFSSEPDRGSCFWVSLAVVDRVCE